MKTKVALILIAGLLVGSVGAALIAVPDAGFEGITMSFVYLQPSGEIAPTTQWSAQDNSRAWVGNQAVYAGGNYPAAPQGGDSWGALNNTTISQSFAETFVDGYTYTFSFWGLDTAATAWGIYARLNDGTDSDGYTASQDVKQLTTAAPGSSWTQYSVIYTADADDVGQNIGISLWGDAGTFVDDVTLSYVIPEPATLGLFGIIGASMLFIRRKFAL